MAIRQSLKSIIIGLFTPIVIYLGKYLAMRLGWHLDFEPPIFWTIPKRSIEPNYVPKTDYVAFCLPQMVLALSSLLNALVIKDYFKKARFSLAALNIFLISATLFSFV